jgi:cardiolipin synthase
MKKLVQLLSRRSTAVFFSLIIQLSVLIAVLLGFSGSFYLFSAASLALSFIVVIWILNDSKNPAFKLAWIIPILAFPIFGGIFYLLFGRNRLDSRMRDNLAKAASFVSDASSGEELIQEAQGPRGYRGDAKELQGTPGGEDSLKALEALDLGAALQARYISNASKTSLSRLSNTVYLSPGETAFSAILRELEAARHYIFLEFFIIAEDGMWSSIFEILERKAKAGLDVRVMYDDFGGMGRLPRDYYKTLRSKGIRCAVFNPFRLILSSTHNHRDHRKILVIDGTTAFTGGINLADEYINKIERFGHWKDNALMIKGEAVGDFTRMFLRLWNFAAPDRSDLPRIPANREPAKIVGDGFVLPYEDNPLDEEPVGVNVYLSLIMKAKRYLYITTPYLIIDEGLSGALCLAAKSGVDVRIITPGVPDKWYVHAVTRANYRPLLKAGVRIFEYSPGFIHSKSFLADDKVGTIGTINLDFRSFYLHFECGVWLYGCTSLLALKEDFLATQDACREVTMPELDKEKLYRKASGWLLKVFSPLF